MRERTDWSRDEVDACVADYLHMLTMELNGQRYNKTEHAKVLLGRLHGRSRASVEFKHCNISAAMHSLGYPCIHGYKPRANYQTLLIEAIEAQVIDNFALQTAAEAAVSRPATASTNIDLQDVWVPCPQATRIREVPAAYRPRFSATRRDYLAEEARNRSLGRAGELFVIELEARRLHAAGRKTLADRVEHVAITQGDGLGFDVLSFDETGKERLIEVKTTAFGELTPFYVSRNELARSEVDANAYRLYRVFDFRNRPRVFDVPGSICASFDLQAETFLARWV